MITKHSLLDWTNVADWRDAVVDAALQHFAPERSREWLLTQKVDSRCWDASDWYDPLRVESGIDDYDEFFRSFGRQIPALFERLRTVHLCRPLNFETYRIRGIVRLSPLEAQNDLIAFMKSQHPQLTDAAIDGAIARANDGLERRKEKVFVAIDERYMLEHAGHYAVFGSEYHLCIARELGAFSPDYRQTLRRRGQPAYVVIHLPLTVLNDEDLKGLAGDLLPAAISSFHLGLERPFFVGSAWDISMDVPPEMIHEIVHAPQAKSHWASDLRLPWPS